MKEEVQAKQNEIETLEEANEELLKYIDNLQKSLEASYKGKDITEVKNKSRTLKKIAKRARAALWISKSFGLDVVSITFKEVNTGVAHTSSMSTDGSENKDDYDAIANDDQEKLDQILFLLDKFCVGDAFYHELTMTTNNLPKSYLIKQRWDQLNDICHISPTPGNAEGAEVPFKELLQSRLEDFFVSNPDFDFEKENVKIKISGDGARMTRNTSFIILSFALLQGNNDVMSAKGNHTIAVVKGSEKYQTLKESFSNAFNDINSMNVTKTTSIAGKNVNIEFFLRGDYKFILIMLGLKGATSHYACAWCKIHKDNRWDMSFDLTPHQWKDHLKK